MPQYFFATSDNEGSLAPNEPFEFPDDAAAIRQARQTLAEMALDGLPCDGAHPLEVRIYQTGDLLAEFRLEYSENVYGARRFDPS